MSTVMSMNRMNSDDDHQKLHALMQITEGKEKKESVDAIYAFLYALHKIHYITISGCSP